MGRKRKRRGNESNIASNDGNKYSGKSHSLTDSAVKSTTTTTNNFGMGQTLAVLRDAALAVTGMGVRAVGSEEKEDDDDDDGMSHDVLANSKQVKGEGGESDSDDDEENDAANDDWQVAESRRAKRKRLNGNTVMRENQKGSTEDEGNEIHPNDKSVQASSEPAESVKRERRKKKEKTPSITHSPNVRLKSEVRLSDLQGLVLYLLADGPAPQWVAIKNKARLERVVVLMVPGLEAGMFNGDLDLKEGTDEKESADGEREEKTAMKGPKDDATTVTNITTATSRISGLSPDDYYPIKLEAELLSEPLKPLANIFTHVWPIKTPGDDRYSKIHSPLQAMLLTPLPKTLIDGHYTNSAEKTRQSQDEPNISNKGNNWQNFKTPITAYLATADELLDNEYVLHPALVLSSSSIAAKSGSNDGKENEETLRRYWKDREEMGQGKAGGWVDSRVDISEIKDSGANASTTQRKDKESPHAGLDLGWKVISIDCEMCKTAEDRFELTRVSMVDDDGAIVLDELVKPENPITDYLTQYSGMTKEKLDPIATTLSDIQACILDLLSPQTILTGHSLNADLAALKLTHPYIIDTTLIYPHPRGLPLKSSLRWLTKKYLGREIQQSHGSTGHDSVEDACATLDLVKQKCAKGPQWGTSEASSEPIFKRLTRVWEGEARAEARAVVAKLKSVISTSDEGRNDATPTKNEESSKDTVAVEQKGAPRDRCAIVDWGDSMRGFGAHADIAISCRNDYEVVNGVRSVLNFDQDGAATAEAAAGSAGNDSTAEHDDKGGKTKNGENLNIHESDASSASSSKVTFIWARLRELEAFRGWWNRNRNSNSSNNNNNNDNNAHTNRDQFSSTTPPLPSQSGPGSEASARPATLFSATKKTVSDIAAIYASLPPRTAFIVYTGSGDPRETARLQAQQQTYRREYSNMKKKWDELSVQWTDVEEKQLREACARARRGIGFVGVKA